MVPIGLKNNFVDENILGPEEESLHFASLLSYLLPVLHPSHLSRQSV